MSTAVAAANMEAEPAPKAERTPPRTPSPSTHSDEATEPSEPGDSPDRAPLLFLHAKHELPPRPFRAGRTVGS